MLPITYNAVAGPILDSFFSDFLPHLLYRCFGMQVGYNTTSWYMEVGKLFDCTFESTEEVFGDVASEIPKCLSYHDRNCLDAIRLNVNIWKWYYRRS